MKQLFRFFANTKKTKCFGAPPGSSLDSWGPPGTLAHTKSEPRKPFMKPFRHPQQIQPD